MTENVTLDDEPDPTDSGQWRGPKAADGGRRHPSAHSLGDLMRMLEDGQFEADVMAELQDKAGELENMNAARPGKLTMELDIKVKFVRELDGVFMITPSFKIKMPTADRARSVAWLTADNTFTPNKPNQGHLFGDLRAIDHR